jgi:hypothetical protein
MNWSLIIPLASCVVIFILVFLLRFGQLAIAMKQSRASFEIQTRILSCLEEIKDELKGLNAAKES